jgi:long-chain fatty acid transport protein
MKQKKYLQAMVPLTVIAVALTAAKVANASGFALSQQGVKQVGSATSGGAASAEDASTIFYNPAGMTRLKGAEVIIGGHILGPSVQFSGSATTNPSMGGATISGGNGGDAGFEALIPTLYFANEVSQGLWIGAGINVPFGLATEYESDWAGRYHALKTDFATININPSVAYKVNEKLSLGGGLNVMWATAELSNAIDYSAACLSAAPSFLCSILGMDTPGDRATDGSVSIEGDSWAYGYNFGLLYELTEQTRIGFSYRSKVDHEIDGKADFTEPTGVTFIPSQFSDILADGGVTSSVELPAIISLSGTTQVAPKWQVMADLTVIQWSSFEELRIKFDNPQTPDSAQPENWEDSYKIALGFNYQHNDTWTFRGGIAYDKSPIPGVEQRTPRIPDNDRKWIAGGFTYSPSPALMLDLALTHLFVGETGVDSTDTAFGHQLTGSYELDAYILSAQANWKF